VTSTGRCSVILVFQLYSIHALTRQNEESYSSLQEISIAVIIMDALNGKWRVGVYYTPLSNVTSIDWVLWCDKPFHENKTWLFSVKLLMTYLISLTILVVYVIRTWKIIDCWWPKVNGFALVIGALASRYKPYEVQDGSSRLRISANYKLRWEHFYVRSLCNGFKSAKYSGRDVLLKGAPSVADAETY